MLPEMRTLLTEMVPRGGRGLVVVERRMDEQGRVGVEGEGQEGLKRGGRGPGRGGRRKEGEVTLVVVLRRKASRFIQGLGYSV